MRPESDFLSKSFFFLALFCLSSLVSLETYSQIYTLDSNLDGSGIVTCSGTFYDSGGPAGNYMNNEDYVVTFCSANAGEPINLDMILETEITFDQISVFDGPTTSSAQFPGSPFAGSTSFMITSTGTCITVAFSSGSIVTESGWVGNISCGVIDPCSSSLTVNAVTPSGCSLCDGTASLNYSGMAFPTANTLSLDGAVLDIQIASSSDIDYIGLCAGNYELSVQDTDGCTYSETLVITSLNSPDVMVSGADDFCAGGQSEISLDLTGTGPWTLSYTLDGGMMPDINIPSNPFSIFMDTAGDYELTNLIDQNCDVPLSTTFTLLETASPTADLSGNGNLCAGSFADLEIDLTGSAPWAISYTFDGIPQVDILSNDPLYILSVDAEGDYELTAVSDGSCTGTVSGIVTVIQSGSTSAILNGGGQICEGETAQLNTELFGAAPFDLTYAIDGVAQTPLNINANFFSIDLDTPGTYTLLEVLSNGCEGTVSGEAIIEVLPVPTLFFPDGNDAQICQGGSVNLPIELTGTGPWTLEYSIDFGAVINLDIDASPYTLTASQTGFYSFGTMVDQVCSTDAGSFVNVSLITTPSAQLTQDLTICIGGNDELPVLVSDAGTYDLTYAIDGFVQPSISITGPDATLIADQEGTYSLVIMTQGVCEGNVFGLSDVVAVSPPTANLLDDISFCQGNEGIAEVSLTGASPWTIDYTIDGLNQGAVELFVSPAQLAISSAGLVSILTVEDQICTGSNGSTISATELALPVASISGDNLICQGAESTLQVDFSGLPNFQANLLLNGNFYESIDTDLSSFPIQVQGNGLYTLSNVSDGQCAGSAIGNANISYYSIPIFNVPLDTALCIGESLSISGSATAGAGVPFSYSWLNGIDTVPGNTISLSPSSSQALTFLVTDACAFPYAQQISVTVHQNPVVELGNSISELCGTSQVILDTETPLQNIGEDCIWYIGKDTIYGCEALTYTFDSTGTYDVGLFVTTIQGCSSETFYPGLVTINERPQADFDFNPSTPSIIENLVSFTDLSLGADSYEWFLDSIIFSELANPVLSFPSQESTETWEVCQVIKTDLGCSDTLCKSIRLEGELAVFVPDAFTPDGDQVNDFFFPQIVGGSDEEYLFQIFDRLGNLVWETKDIQAKWSGQGANDSSYFTRDNVYTWRMEVKRKNSVDKQLFQGIVTIIR